jgi:hypothetical protein
MSQELQDLLIELRKGIKKYALPALSYIGLSLLLGYCLVNYISLPKIFYGTSFSISGFFGIIDILSDGDVSILKKLRLWWAKLPIYIHVWIIIDCIAYFYLFKAYIRKPLWQNQ